MPLPSRSPTSPPSVLVLPPMTAAVENELVIVPELKAASPPVRSLFRTAPAAIGLRDRALVAADEATDLEGHTEAATAELAGRVG